jgi:hypothetical protein
VTDPANGSFVLRKLKAGDYDFVVTPHDTCYPGQTATVTVPAGSLVSQTFLLSRGSTPAAATPAPPANSEAAPPDQPSEPGPATPDR